MKNLVYSSSIRKNLARVGEYTLIALALAMVIIPLYWLFLTSVKRPVDIFTVPPVWIPEQLTTGHYRTVMQVNDALPYFINSLIIASVSTLFSTLLGAFGAYALARVQFPFKVGVFMAYWILMTRMYPAVCTAVPYFLIIKSLGLLDTRIALILTYTGFNLPFVVWTLLGFFSEIPISIEEASIVDGATLFDRFVKVIIPISIPGLVVAAVFSFILAWNEFLFAVILTTFRAKTIPVVVASFITDRALQWGPMCALAFIAIIPVLVFILLVQKNFVRGLTFGAVKE